MLKVTPIPILSDNYVWVIHSPDEQECIIVDPGAAANVVKFIISGRMRPSAILVTHSHYDHIDGITELIKRYDIPVFGPRSSAIPQVTEPLSDGDSFRIWDQAIRVLQLPGHMPEHLAYVFEHKGLAQIFSGDVLFSSGCGRIFIGTHEQLKSSLDRLKAFPENTLIYPTHEYTLANLDFAREVEPNNEEIKERQRKVQNLRKENLPTLPTTIGLEKLVNPFLRSDQQEVLSSVSKRLEGAQTGELETFITLRRWKDHF